jgi:hypothetical protein
MMRVLFVSDQHHHATRSDGIAHPGGAELTDRTAVESCPWPIEWSTIDEIDVAAIAAADLLVVANIGRASMQTLAQIAAHPRYVLFEHDVRVCRWRGNFFGSRERFHGDLSRCWCPHRSLWPLLDHAHGLVYLTRRQRGVYLANPFYREPPCEILGCSLFGEAFFARVAEAARATAATRRGTWVLHSPNRIKGTERALDYCRARGWDASALRNLAPAEVLDRLAVAERFVYLPGALEPAGRMPVEARALGCEVVVNDNLGVGGEPWWEGERDQALAFLAAAPERFWRLVRKLAEGEPRRAPGAARAALAAGAELCLDALTARPLPAVLFARAAHRLEAAASRGRPHAAWKPR